MTARNGFGVQQRAAIGATAIALGVTALANAQSPQVFNTFVDLQLAFEEVLVATNGPGNGNGIIEPGEGARISLTVLMTPPVNSQVGYDPTALPGSGVGTLRGLMSVFFDLVGSNNATGAWSQLSVRSPWDLIGPAGHGTIDLGGARLRSIQAGQFPWNAGSTITENPIPEIWSGLWIPSSFAVRTAHFTGEVGTGNPLPFVANVVVRLSPGGGSTTVAAGTSAGSFGGGLDIPIVPAPSSLGLLGLGGLVALRRRR